MKRIHLCESRLLYCWLTTNICDFDEDDIYVMVSFERLHLERLQNHIKETYRIKTPLYLPSPDGQYGKQYWQELSMIKQWVDTMLRHFNFKHNQLLFSPAHGFNH